jgi:DNA-directed RNA polymerase specialized sigma24 family protein
VIISGDSGDALGQRLDQVASDTQDLLARMLGLLPCDDLAACHRLLNDVKALEDGLVERARAAGATNREIGQALGVSEAAARKRLRTHGYDGGLVPELGLQPTRSA